MGAPMPTYAALFPPKKTAKEESRTSTLLLEQPAVPAPTPRPQTPALLTSRLQPVLNSPSSSIVAAASGADKSHPPPYTQKSDAPLTPWACRPSSLDLSTPAISHRLSSQPSAPSPLGKYMTTPLFLNNKKDNKDEFGPANTLLLATAGSTPPSSPMTDPFTPCLPLNPVWHNVYGVGLSSPSYALKQMPNMTNILSQLLSLPTPSPPSPIPAHVHLISATCMLLVKASAMDLIVTVCLPHPSLAHVSGTEVVITNNGASALASRNSPCAVAVMPKARLATLSFINKGVAHTKVARDPVAEDAPSPLTLAVVDHPPAGPPEAVGGST
jgi:hypothetical protein